MPVLRLCGGTRFMGRSSNVSTPLSGVRKPATMRRHVVLPQPDGPSKKNNSPSRTSRLKSFTAIVLSKSLLTF
jgi:hypothetical protein